MAIKVSGTTVIDDNREFTPALISGKYSNFQPVTTVNSTSNIDCRNPVQAITLTSNTTFATSFRAAGRQIIIRLDRTATGYNPTFGSEVDFAGGTPTWSNRRHWTIVLTCWNSSTIRATAVGFNEPGTVSSSMDSTFNVNQGSWGFANDFGTSFEQAWSKVDFQHQTSNNRIRVQYASGNTQAFATTYTEYINYTGMSGTITVTVQYNGTFSTSGTTNQATFGPRPQDDGYNSGTYYSVPTSGVRTFGWMAANNPNLQSSSGVGGSFSAPGLRVKLVSNEGTFYSTETPSIVQLGCNYGSQNEL